MSYLQKGFLKDSSRWTSYQSRMWMTEEPETEIQMSSFQPKQDFNVQDAGSKYLVPSVQPKRGGVSSFGREATCDSSTKFSLISISENQLQTSNFSPIKDLELMQPRIASTPATPLSSQNSQNQIRSGPISGLTAHNFLSRQLKHHGPQLTSTPLTQQRRAIQTSPVSTIYKGNGSLNTSFTSNSRFNMTELNSSSYVAVMEGRGNARGEVGIACISLDSPTLALCQFSDTSTYARTLTKLSVFQPAKILLPRIPQFNKNEVPKLYKEIADLHGIGEIIFVNRKYFDESQGLQMVKDLCAPQFSSVELQLCHKFYALAAAHSLLKYVEFMEHVVFTHKTLRIEFQSSTNSVLIDVETARNVELVYPNFNVKSSNSLFGFLNRCSTPGGSRFLRSCIFQPTVLIENIEIRLEAIEELLTRPDIMNGLTSSLLRFTDLDQLLALCVFVKKDEQQQSVITKKIDRMICLKNALELINPILTILATGVKSKYLLATRESLQNPTYQKILAKLKEVFHDDASTTSNSSTMKLQRCFAVCPKVDGLLDIARQTYCEIIDAMERHVATLSEIHGLPLRLAFNGQKGYHIQLSTNKNLRLTLNDLPQGFLRPHKFKSMFTFVTNEILHLDQRSQETLKEINIITNTVLSRVLVSLRDDIGCLYYLNEAISSLDMILSLTQVASMPGFVKPTFGSRLEVRDSKHPILVHLANNRSKTGRFHRTTPVETTLDVVPNDILATSEFCFQILTGINMSGKSTYLKQIVLLQIMAQIGSYVPAVSAKFRIADSIFARIGTGDSLECNASTFSVECKEMSYILHNMTPSSLIVVDELGRSTSNDEAAALCWAIAEDIIAQKAVAFFATHFTILCNLESLYSEAKNFFFSSNGLMGSEGESLPPHKLIKGRMAHQNYGLDFARAVSFPSESLKRAEHISKHLGDTTQFVWRSSDEQNESVNIRKLVYRLKSLASNPFDDIKGELVKLQHLFKQDPED